MMLVSLEYTNHDQKYTYIPAIESFSRLSYVKHTEQTSRTIRTKT